MTNEAIIKIALTFVHINFMVIAKRKLGKVAVEVKHHIAIDVNKEVTLAFFCVDETLNLIFLVEVVRLGLLEGLLVLGAREGRLNLRLVVLVGVLETEELCIIF
jgi:hypothetical protein